MQKKERSERNNKAITLIALIITVIVMLILAGVTFNLLIGENGIFTKTGQAKQIHEEQAAKEKLEMAMGDLVLRKYQDSNYNEDEYMDSTLASQNIILIDNIAIVDNWSFEIDRSVPKVIQNLGEKKESQEIQVVVSSTMKSDYSLTNLQAEIKFEGNLKEIRINGKVLEEIPTPQDGVYKIEKEVLENGNYVIMVNDDQGNYKIEKIAITEIAEDMDIWNREDLEKFRDKANKGATFVGKTVRVMAEEIDLAGNENNQWIPIKNFAGTFEGNNHSIKNLYINSNQRGVGFFSTTIQNATLKQIKLENVNITGQDNVGGIVGFVNSNGDIDKCSVSGSISGEGCVGGIAGRTAPSTATISNCKVDASVSGGWPTGGIVGYTERPIKFCGKYGQTTSKRPSGEIGMVGGIVGELQTSYIYGCVNKGNVTGVSYVGGIVGDIRANTYVSYCYSTGTIEATGSAPGNFSACGGIAGEAYGNIDHCFVVGTIKAKADCVGGILGMATSSIKVEYLMGLADVYRDGVHVDVYAWDKNNSGGLYGKIANITHNNLHSYNKGVHTIDGISWYSKEFVMTTSPGVPKLRWEE